MTTLAPGTSLAWDWYAGTVPDNVSIDESAYVETTFSFVLMESRAPEAVAIGRGAATYLGTMFDLGPDATVKIGEFAFVHGVWFISDAGVEVGDHCMLSWNVVLMDTYRSARDVGTRREELRALARRPDRRPRTATPGRPIRIGANVWIGFDVVVMPGVTVGDGAVVGAKSVVFDDVEPYTLVAGNPARFVRRLEAGHGG